MEAPAAGGVG